MNSYNRVYKQKSDRGTAIIHRENISDFTNTSTNSYAAATWQHSFTGISRCNIILDRLPNADIPETTKLSVSGQAKFLRALNFFKLVQLYGPVPLFVKEVTTADDAFKTRNPVEEIYAQIVKDAGEAITELAAPAAFPQTGRATKGSATILLAEVYAVQKKWAEAETLLKTLPSMGYQLIADYAQVFLPTNKNNRESLFEVQYLGGTETGTTPNAMSIHFLPMSTNARLLTGQAINSSGNVGGWNIPSNDLISDYEANDKRLDASIGIIEGVRNGSNFLAYETIKSARNYVAPAGKTGVPYIKKYINSTYPAPSGSSNNFPIYRFAGALLLLAEALNEQGRTGDAVVPLNQVRARAGLAATSATSQAALRTVILHEQRVELAFENQRWTTLLRTGRAIDVINAFGTRIRQEQLFLTPDAYLIDQHRLLFPVPQADLDLNPGLGQNPGY